MKRIMKVLLAGFITVVAILFIEYVLNFESEPYYALIIFLIVAGTFGLLDKKK